MALKPFLKTFDTLRLQSYSREGHTPAFLLLSMARIQEKHKRVCIDYIEGNRAFYLSDSEMAR